ncbi:MAG TPA: rhodanese-like domain-containing protein, partial [Archangium sp.]
MTRLTSLSLATTLLLSATGCQPEAAGPEEKPLAVRSSDDYAQNVSGLVTASTVTRWLSSWEANKPVTGELIVLQLDEVPGDAKWIASSPGVRAYHAPELLRILEPRSNGVLAVGGVPANGSRMDTFLRRFDIDPATDLVLLASGSSTPRTLSQLTRAWLSLRYWGLGHEHLALLNGPASEVTPLSPTYPDLPFTGTVRVLGLPDRFELLADLGTVKAAVGATPLLDVRTRAEFDGTAPSVSTLDATCLDGLSKCTGTFSGRIAGATHLEWTRFVAGDRFRDLATLDAVLTDVGVDRSRAGIVYDADGHESALVSFAFLAILGVPAQWYAPGFVEWSALNASHPSSGLQALPSSSAWRTDVSSLTQLGAWADVGAGVRP